MDIKKFFKLVAKQRKGGELSETELAELDVFLNQSSDIQALVDKGQSALEEIQKLESKVSKLEIDNFKYRERARTQDTEVEEAVAKATKKLQGELDKAKEETETLKQDLEKQANEAATAALEKSLLQAGVPEELLGKALKLVDESHYTEEKTKGEDGKEIVTKTFDKEKFREDNAILFTGSQLKMKGIGGAGQRGKKPEDTTLQGTERYIASQYSRPDKRGK